VGRIAVIVTPGARRTELVGRQGDAWKLRVSAPPERGRANAAVCALVADLVGVSPRDVRVAAGTSARRKVVDVAGVETDEVAARLDLAS
jgi:uncharacterized protein